MHMLNLAQGDKSKPDYLKINPTVRISNLIDPDSPGGKAPYLDPALGDPLLLGPKGQGD